MPMWGGGFSGVISSASSSIATYRVDFAATAFTAAGANQFFMLGGSGTKVVKLIQFFIWKPSVNINLSIIKQSTLTTGGTSSTPTPIPLDSSNAAATAVATLWTNGTGSVAGTAVGTTLLTLNMTPGDAFGDSPGNNTGQAFTLRSATQAICFTCDANATLRGFVEFTEA